MLSSTSHVIQLLIALGGAVLIFTLAFAGYARALFIGIVVMIPFQPIDSAYGSVNMAVTYVVGFAILLNSFRNRYGNPIRAPLIASFLLLLLAYLMSWAIAPRMFYSKYTIYLILLGSDVVLFFISYEFFKKEKDIETFFKALIFSNALVVVYCIIQYFAGHGQLSFFGITELSVLENRWDERLVGPFQAVGITAEYLVIQSLLLAHYMVHAGKLRRMGYLLLFCNLAIMIGTGNRGGFIIAILGVFSFMYFYKRYIGGRGIAIAGLVFFVLLAVTSFIMVTYTDYNTLYERLLDTHISGITPDTRIGWGGVVEEIINRPVLGHGPKLVLQTEYDSVPRDWPQGYINYYPHSLYLYILYTIGIVGFLAFTNLAFNYWRRLSRTRRLRRNYQGIGKGLPTLGMIVFVLFMIDQFKVEFLRPYLLDYQHYIAAIFGMFASLEKLENDARGSNEVQTASKRTHLGNVA